MHDLPTPAPSSDPIMQGSSPSKAMQRRKPDSLRAFPTQPLAPLDLNISSHRFQAERRKDGATPPSSPPSTVNSSSPLAPSLSRQLGYSPTKQQRSALSARITVGNTRFTTASHLELCSTTARKETVSAQIIGLVENSKAALDAEAVPRLLFGSRTTTLVIGRCKPSGEPHSYDGDDTRQDKNQASDALPAGSNTPDTPSSTRGFGAPKILRVNLPNDARHVSRVHAIVEWIPFVSWAQSPKKSAGSPGSARQRTASHLQQQNGTFIVRIIGQNGLIVDGKRRREGQVLRLTPGKSLLDFFGVECRFEYYGTTKEDKPESQRPSLRRVTSPLKRGPRQQEQELPSSPPMTSSPLPAPHFSPSKARAKIRRTRPKQRFADREEENREDEEDSAGSPAPAQRRVKGLSAGPLAIKKVKAGASDLEDNVNEQDDEDYLLERFETPLKTIANPWPKQTSAEPLQIFNSSLTDVDHGDDEETPFVTPQASNVIQSRPQERIKTAERSSSGERQNGEAITRPAQVDALTDSQIRMPPPPNTVSAVVRSSAGRSASNSPAPTSPLVGASVQHLQNLARTCVGLLAPTYDLAGLLAGAVVFHRTATISGSEAVRSVLATTPGLMKGEAGEYSIAFSPSKRKLPGTSTLEHGRVVEGWPVHETNERWISIARKAWREYLEVVLQSSPMFGVIQRAGKDASGNDLECWYYYDKENDPDKERAQNLGVFAKPMRKALRGQKPIFWKRSGYVRQQEELAEAKAASSAAAAEAESIGTFPDEDESLAVATGPLPNSAIGLDRKRKAMSQPNQITQTSQATSDASMLSAVERKRELLRAKIARSGLWDETQPEEKEVPTWDRQGDQDYRKRR